MNEPIPSISSARRGVCVFCASSSGTQPAFLDEAKMLGKAIVERGWSLIYGGAHVGLMGAVADSALAHGGSVIGVIPRALVQREIAHRGLTELIEVETMHERKAEMAGRADGFLVLPGGLGTLDEMCEILTWSLLGIHQKPLVLIDVAGYWRPFLAMLDGAVTSGFLRPVRRSLLQVAGDSREACASLAETWL